MVGEMEIYHSAQSEVGGTFGLRHYVRDGIPSVFRVDPYAEPYGVDAAVVAQQLHALHLLALRIRRIELVALGLKLAEPAYIGSFGIRLLK